MASYSKDRFENEEENQVTYGGRSQATKARSSRRPHYGRGQRPSGTNGIHRRRNKRWSW